MTQFGSVKALKLLLALLKLGWSVERETGGSHKVLEREGWPEDDLARGEANGLDAQRPLN